MDSKSAVELKLAALREELLLKYAEQAHSYGLLGKSYMRRMVAHGLAVIGGTEPPGEGRLDVLTFLTSRGFSSNQLQDHVGRFGKLVKTTYEEKHGIAPEKVWTRIDGGGHWAPAYYERDVGLFEVAFAEMFGSNIPE